MVFVRPSFVRNCYKKRNEKSKKHDFGYVAVIGGSKIYSGAPTLVGLAAMRAGADLSFVISPKEAYETARSYPDLISINLGTDYFTNMTNDAWMILGMSDALVIGNGLTQGGRVKEMVSEVLEQYKKPVVIDADALRFLTDLDVVSEDAVLTPHISEFKSISGSNPLTLDEKIKESVEFAESTGFTVLLKGQIDIIASEHGSVLNKTGNAFMTKGGTGDTLAGICGALLARGIDGFSATSSAAYLNGFAGEIASRKFAEGTLATDVIDAIPQAVKSSIKLFGFF